MHGSYVCNDMHSYNNQKTVAGLGLLTPPEICTVPCNCRPLDTLILVTVSHLPGIFRGTKEAFCPS